ncbi:helix-turn-helix transcriptional regulator [Xanthobacter sp. V4C-4]|uniref:helix-turn-helix transcriptional regulator n=1 Tax=Xanthobacter cornucopiae TaxID=3119924 RepID=UPI0037291C91
MSDLTIASAAEIESHPIYVDFFRRVGFGWLMTAVMLPDADSFVGLSVPRAKWKGAFTAEELEVLRLIGRHVEQSLRLSLRISNLEASHVALLSGLDAVASAFYALNAGSELVLANKMGREQFDTYFCLREGRMTPRAPAERARFAGVVAAAANVASAPAGPEPCVVSGTDGRRMVVWAMPLVASSRWRLGRSRDARILVLAVPLERDKVVDPALIRNVFGLSLGEARLAALIGSGLGVPQAADQLGITQGTARVVLKRIFAKLGVNRQAELVLHLSSLRAVP